MVRGFLWGFGFDVFEILKLNQTHNTIKFHILFFSIFLLSQDFITPTKE